MEQQEQPDRWDQWASLVRGAQPAYKDPRVRRDKLVSFLPPVSDCANTALTHRKTHNSAEKLILKILVIYTPSEPVRVRTTVTLIPDPGSNFSFCMTLADLTEGQNK